jgi:predicted TIM-barrel fold metal-dependent hydrolase
MLTRRTMMAGASALGAIMIEAPLKPLSAGGPKPTIAVNFEVPRGACDAHVHVVGDPTEFPMAADRDYTPTEATADSLRAALKFLNVDRVVIVTSTNYGLDNSSTLASIKQLGRHRARGVALIDETTSPETLDSYKAAGITGVRLFFSDGEAFNAGAAREHLQWNIDLAKQRNWHLDISTPPDVIASLAAQLATSPVPVALDDFGWLAGGVGQPGFAAIISLLKSGHIYVKLAEPYRVSRTGPDYPELAPVVRALVAANPERILWGSGWPHVNSNPPPHRSKFDPTPNLPVDAGHLLNLFAAWVPDAATRRTILVDNPARLYGFGS